MDSRSTNWTADLNLNKDRGWGVMAFEGADKLTPSRINVLKNKLIAPGLTCASDGNTYIFLTSLNIWSVMASSQSMVYINSLLGIESASVNYGSAFDPYVSFIERETADKLAEDIPLSICIGTERLRVSVITGGLKLNRCESLMSFLPKEKAILSVLCYMPLSIRIWPSVWYKTSDYKMYQFLSPLFRDAMELKTIEWAIGHALIDPHSYSKTVLLYGEGGHGKSTMLSVLNSALMGCCGTIPDSALLGLSAGIPAKVASIVASNRVVTAGDVGGHNRNTNLTVIKTLTGHDFLTVPPSRVKTACTLFYASNLLDNPLENEEWCTPAIMRRVVVVLMNAKIIEDFSGRVPQDAFSRLDFALRCVHTRLTNPHMPVSVVSILLTIMGSRYNDVAKFIVIADDYNLDDDEVMTANAIVGAVINKTVAEVGELAKRISRIAIVTIRGIDCIRGIVPSTAFDG